MAIVLALLTFFSTMAGGLIGRRSSAKLHLFLGLAAGMLLGAALFDLLPEGLAIAQATGRTPIRHARRLPPPLADAEPNARKDRTSNNSTTYPSGALNRHNRVACISGGTLLCA